MEEGKRPISPKNPSSPYLHCTIEWDYIYFKSVFLAIPLLKMLPGRPEEGLPIRPSMGNGRQDELPSLSCLSFDLVVIYTSSFLYR